MNVKRMESERERGERQEYSVLLWSANTWQTSKCPRRVAKEHKGFQFLSLTGGVKVPLHRLFRVGKMSRLSSACTRVFWFDSWFILNFFLSSSYGFSSHHHQRFLKLTQHQWFPLLLAAILSSLLLLLLLYLISLPLSFSRSLVDTHTHTQNCELYNLLWPAFLLSNFFFFFQRDSMIFLSLMNAFLP